ncbi:delta(14)-sterol reductase TM7SF2 isoform X1 [Microplitis demolitor]|uniref:delta(14)-sterol reductase TM7SF2 isoform X1 n=1 Tax=Microplitis demolitor TaxID=69319 RepID=UPI0004CCBD3B|nr:delta(14)-sterol reductase TM7SF2 isoform X1 [Microplitis demolitor]
MKFMAGEQVLAKPPNIDEFKKGKILIARGDKYVIQFEGGKEHTVLANNIQPERPSRGTTRTIRGKLYKSPLRKSPARKSPSRRSPGRSPSRRSPGRSPGRPKRPLKITSKRSDDEKSFKTDSQSTMSESDDISELIPLQSRLKDQQGTTATRRSVRILNNLMKESSVNLRGIDRAVSLPVERKTIMYEYLADTKERGFSVQREPDIQKLYYEEEVLPDSSTTDKIKKQEKTLEIELVSKPQEWFGWIGAMLNIILLPCAVLLPQIACHNNKCLLAGFKVPSKLQTYFNGYVALAYGAFLVLVAALSFLPIGRAVDGMQMRSGRLQYRLNGLYIALIVLITFKLGDYFGYDTVDLLMKNLLRLSVLSWITGLILSVILYIKGGKIPLSTANIYGSTGNHIYDYWQGREINPRVAKLDVKLFLTRISLIGTLMINMAVILKSAETVEFNFGDFKDLAALKSLGNLNFTVIIVCIMQMFYCFDGLLFEETNLTSFRVLYEGTGYMTCVASLLYPFLITLGPRYLLAQQVNKSAYVLAPLVLAFLIGYVLYRWSNLQKHHFRLNPYSQESLRLETIPTDKGKKLIVSGFWGKVRHPNYFGDIIMNWAMVLVETNTNVLLYWSAICCTIVLVHRALRDNARCHKRYGAAWENYCSRVKSLLLQRIF